MILGKPLHPETDRLRGTRGHRNIRRYFVSNLGKTINGKLEHRLYYETENYLLGVFNYELFPMLVSHTLRGSKLWY